MQTKGGLTKLVQATLLLQLVLFFGVSNAQNLSVTSRTEDYVIQNQRQYAKNILDYESQLNLYKVSYQQQLESINVQTNLLEEQFQVVDQRLLPLELLNDVSKHCVQKYRSRIASWASVKATLTNCAVSAINSMPAFILPADTTMKNLNSYYNNQVKTALTECQKKNPTSQFNYTLCVTQAISSANTVTIGNQKTFSIQMETAKCSGDGRIKQALDCSFTAQYSAIAMIGETTRLIDNCIAGLEFCPPCREVTPAIAGPTCEAVDVKMSTADYRNATIENPFYGLNNTLPCVQVNFYQVS